MNIGILVITHNERANIILGKFNLMHGKRVILISNFDKSLLKIVL